MYIVKTVPEFQDYWFVLFSIFLKLQTSIVAYCCNNQGPLRVNSPDQAKQYATSTDYGCLLRKSPSLYGQKSTHNPKFLGMAEAYFVCHVDPNFQISDVFIGCP
jgi:hypothetical protein